ncbi:MAG: proteasome assembly chaperone family protein [Micrococcales bacterium]
MVNPSELYELHDDDFDVPRGLHLIAGLTGFTDSGSTIAQLGNHIFENLDYRVVAMFENDELLDYRSRRPIMYFEKDHISSYEPQVLALYLVTDEVGQKFLYLHGYEPDLKWDAFVDAVLELVDIFEVLDFTWVHSIPFPIPHTRPISVTVSGNRKDLIDAVSEWKPQTQVPGNVLHLLEFRFTQEDIPSAGFVMLVPHYLSDVEYPQAVVSAFERITAATGLVFPTDSLRDEGVKFSQEISKNITENPELAKLVSNLETGYNTDQSGTFNPKLSRPERSVPSADEIAAELEDYLSLKRKQSTEDSPE